MKIFYVTFILLLSSISAFAQRELGARPTETGGPLMYEQAAYDVKKYDISVKVDPATQSISGNTRIQTKVVQPIDVFVFDLDTPFNISEVSYNAGYDLGRLRFERKGGKVWAYLPRTMQAGESLMISVAYAGTPRVAPRAPWIGGFMWEKTADGSPWIATAVQNDGADLMFPCKDHPSDKSETTTLRITVPEPLYAATVGKLQKIEKNADKTLTYHWQMNTPVPNYEIVLNIAPYRIIEDKMKSVSGDTIPIVFYILPESYDKGAELIAKLKDYIKFFEEYLGPYPFRKEKAGIVETPHLGMEHATIIAYGNKFRYTEDGFDWLLFHEFGHEWWANLVTASDWRDFWIHEGFQSYMDTLYLEKMKGKQAYMTAMKNRQKATRNMQPVAPREMKIAYQVYMAAPDYLKSDGDIYGKGACVLHTLRYLIGDKAFFTALRRMAYPTKAMEKITDGRQPRFVNTDDFKTIAEQESGMKLDWFFEVYLRQPALPKLIKTASNGKVELRWETPNNLPFEMPIDLDINGKTQRVEMKNGQAVVNWNGADLPITDRESWILKSE
jgi:aminopeptidase N